MFVCQSINLRRFKSIAKVNLKICIANKPLRISYTLSQKGLSWLFKFCVSLFLICYFIKGKKWQQTDPTFTPFSVGVGLHIANPEKGLFLLIVY